MSSTIFLSATYRLIGVGARDACASKHLTILRLLYRTSVIKQDAQADKMTAGEDDKLGSSHDHKNT